MGAASSGSLVAGAGADLPQAQLRSHADAVAAVENFITEVAQFRRGGEHGTHWPEYVWTTMFAEALAGIEALRGPPEVPALLELPGGFRMTETDGGRIFITTCADRWIYHYSANGCHGFHVSADPRDHEVRGGVHEVVPSWWAVYIADLVDEPRPTEAMFITAELLDADGVVVSRVVQSV